MNKTELINEVAKVVSTKKEAQEAVDCVFSSITKAMKTGDTVTLICFGTFKVVDRKARKGRNPQSGGVLFKGLCRFIFLDSAVHLESRSDINLTQTIIQTLINLPVLQILRIKATCGRNGEDWQKISGLIDYHFRTRYLLYRLP